MRLMSHVVETIKMKKPPLESCQIPVFIYPPGLHQPQALVCTSCSQVSVSPPRRVAYLHPVALSPKEPSVHLVP